MEKQRRWAMSASMYRNRKTTQGGFTLVELLVVIAVISILVGMLLPALENAVSAAHQIACMSKMKQISLAVSLYSDEKGGYIPYNFASSYNFLYNRVSVTTGTPFPYYLEVPEAYLDSNSLSNNAPPISMCPNGGRDGTTEDKTAAGAPNFTYGFNTFIKEIRLNSVPNPSNRLLLGELDGNGGYSLSRRDYFQYQHNGFTNIMYVDSHAAPLLYFDVPYFYDDVPTNDPDDFYKTH
jgi:prepilin-type N-terminal cleavage/methylation domain-containing protein/prepilin-type processing-associated H-X9-DG protein